MANINPLIFDIKTLPKELDKDLEWLLYYKLRNTVEEEKEQKKLQYLFHEPQFAKAVSISVIWFDKDGNIKENIFFSRDDEKEIVNQFFDFIKNFKGRFITYNGLDFDVPFLLYKCVKFDIIPSDHFCNVLRFKTFPHYDLMQILTFWGKFKISLDEVLNDFNIKNYKDLINKKNIFSFMLNASDEEIKTYSLEDVRSTYELYKKVINIFN